MKEYTVGLQEMLVNEEEEELDLLSTEEEEEEAKQNQYWRHYQHLIVQVLKNKIMEDDLQMESSIIVTQITPEIL